MGLIYICNVLIYESTNFHIRRTAERKKDATISQKACGVEMKKATIVYPEPIKTILLLGYIAIYKLK